MGQVFYDMGFLSSIEVVECSTSDLIGQYVGHTGPKTKKVLEKARGRVLFIDEAYRLGEGQFAKEAVDEIVNTLTLEQYRGKIVVILAGYDQEINDMLSVNPGLSSRFTEEIIFTNMTPTQSIELLEKELANKRVVAGVLKDSGSPDYQDIVRLLTSIAQLPSWGNGRDLKELARRMVTHVFTTQTNTPGSKTPLLLSGAEIITCIAEMYSQRMERAAKVSSKKPKSGNVQTAPVGPQRAPTPPSAQTSASSKAPPPPPPPPPEEQESGKDGRDPGVSDAIWEQLQRDRRAQEEAEKQAEEDRRAIEEALQLALKKEQEEAEALRKLLAAEKAAKDEAERQELLRRQEELRLRRLAAEAERARHEKMLALRREAEAKRKREEVQVQAKIRRMGVCVQGFQWIKQRHGYRCAGGTHFLSNAVLGI
jgi:ATPase family associated with various cellular activities (AAA)